MVFRLRESLFWKNVSFHALRKRPCCCWNLIIVFLDCPCRCRSFKPSSCRLFSSKLNVLKDIAGPGRGGLGLGYFLGGYVPP